MILVFFLYIFNLFTYTWLDILYILHIEILLFKFITDWIFIIMWIRYIKIKVLFDSIAVRFVELLHTYMYASIGIYVYACWMKCMIYILGCKMVRKQVILIKIYYHVRSNMCNTRLYE